MLRYVALVLFVLKLATGYSSEDFWPANPDWGRYFKNTLHIEEPYPTVVHALSLFSEEKKDFGTTIDLGCGAGRDTLYLLSKSWHVIAMDSSKEAIEIILNKVAEENLRLLDTAVSSFTDFEFPQRPVDFINASRSLPFCSPGDFDSLWERITSHLAIGGRFAGQFFGERDDWAPIPGRTHHTYEEVLKLFEDSYEIEYFVKQEADFPTSSGVMKHWHIFNVVAKKVR